MLLLMMACQPDLPGAQRSAGPTSLTVHKCPKRTKAPASMSVWHAHFASPRAGRRKIIVVLASSKPGLQIRPTFEDKDWEMGHP